MSFIRIIRSSVFTFVSIAAVAALATACAAESEAPTEGAADGTVGQTSEPLLATTTPTATATGGVTLTSPYVGPTSGGTVTTDTRVILTSYCTACGGTVTNGVCQGGDATCINGAAFNCYLGDTVCKYLFPEAPTPKN